MAFAQYWKSTRVWFLALSSREKILVGSALAFVTIYAVWMPLKLVTEKLSVTDRQIELRNQDLSNVAILLRRYSQLKNTVDQIEASYERSQMTFEQVSNELDRVVKESIGSDNYELKRAPNARPIGDRLEQQEFTLRIPNLTLEQLVKLLHQLENGRSALYLNRLDLSKVGGTKPALSATVEISTVAQRKSQMDA